MNCAYESCIQWPELFMSCAYRTGVVQTRMFLMFFSYTKIWMIHTRKWLIHMSYPCKGMILSCKDITYSYTKEWVIHTKEYVVHEETIYSDMQLRYLYNKQTYIHTLTFMNNELLKTFAKEPMANICGWSVTISGLKLWVLHEL